ncbi:MAG: FGGY family carbohydrate kinase [Flavicella sp.]
MQKKVTAIFDIGKTNKKFFLFDRNYNEVYREYRQFDEIPDEDGYPSENLISLKNWIKKTVHKILKANKYQITHLNFSSYGASLVHLDADGKVLSPLYNYTKDIDSYALKSFEKKYGTLYQFSEQTGSIQSGMLHTGMQLYWLKNTQPKLFANIKYSLHLPQYLSYLFTKIPVSEYTSIGCHTALWDFTKKNYHDWVNKENLNKILPPIVPSKTSFKKEIDGMSLKVGVGIHDTSATLIPYLKKKKKNFVLLSTGTWSVLMNPFSKAPLNKAEIENDCNNYMKTDGTPVKSTKILLGMEYKTQIIKLSNHYKTSLNSHTSVAFDAGILKKIENNFTYTTAWKYLASTTAPSTTTYKHNNFTFAYHQLMVELTLEQVKKIEMLLLREPTSIETLYVDGGFSDNTVFIALLSYYLKNMEITPTKTPLGSALGAALIIA